MNLITDTEVREIIRTFAISNFDTTMVTKVEASCLICTGLIGTVGSRFYDHDMRAMCSELCIRASPSMILHFEPKDVNCADIIALMLSTTRVHNIMIPYLNAQCKSISQLTDAETLLHTMSTATDTTLTRHLTRVIPLLPFYSCAVSRIMSERSDIYKLAKIHPALVMGIPDTDISGMSYVFSGMTDSAVAESYKFINVPLPILRHNFESRGILPYNIGLTTETDVEALKPILEQFMRNYRIDFSGYIKDDILQTPEMINIIIDNMCVHVSRNTIRRVLLSVMSYDEIVRRIGMVTHAFIGTRAEYEKYNFPVTRIITATLHELKIILDAVDIYLEMGLRQDLIAALNGNPCLWSYNPNACLEITANQHTEDMYLRALCAADALYADFAFVTTEMLDIIVEKELYDFNIMQSLVSSAQLLDGGYDVLRIEDICSHVSDHIFSLKSMRMAYAEKFANHVLYMYMVKISPLPYRHKMELLCHVPSNFSPMTKLIHYMYSYAYRWAPKPFIQRYPVDVPTTTVNVETINLSSIDIIKVADGGFIQTSCSARKAIFVHELAAQYGGLRSITEKDHKLVRVTIGSESTTAIKFSYAPAIFNTFSEYVSCLLRDLLNMLEQGLLYTVLIGCQEARDVTVEFMSMSEILLLSRCDFRWYNYSTIHDELIRYNSLFIGCNHYISRMRIYVFKAMQYIAYCLLLWRDLGSNTCLRSLLFKIIEEFIPNEDQIAKQQLVSKTVVDIHNILLHGGHDFISIDIFVDELLVGFVTTHVSKSV